MSTPNDPAGIDLVDDGPDGPMPDCSCEDCLDCEDFGAWQSELDGGL